LAGHPIPEATIRNKKSSVFEIRSPTANGRLSKDFLVDTADVTAEIGREKRKISREDQAAASKERQSRSDRDDIGRFLNKFKERPGKPEPEEEKDEWK